MRSHRSCGATSSCTSCAACCPYGGCAVSGDTGTPRAVPGEGGKVSSPALDGEADLLCLRGDHVLSVPRGLWVGDVMAEGVVDQIPLRNGRGGMVGVPSLRAQVDPSNIPSSSIFGKLADVPFEPLSFAGEGKSPIALDGEGERPTR
eukprot:Sspe_Gene.115166::Locus_102127_Transcript_1_1_Confidence_1.000_Length_605::g.115166::m.115166